MSDNKTTKSSSISILAKPSNLECKDLQEYLKSRPPDVLEKLFNYPTICLAVYRYDLNYLYIDLASIIFIKCLFSEGNSQM